MKEQLNRREVVAGGAAVMAASLSGTDVFASILGDQPKLSEEIRDLKKELSKGGSYYAAMRSPRVDENILASMVLRLANVMREFRVLHVAPEMADKDESKFVALREMPGLLTGHIDTYEFMQLPDGRRVPARRFCNFFMLHAQGADYISTANHCIVNAPAEKGFYTNATIGDFAIRRLKEGAYAGTAMTLVYHTSSESVNGLLGVTLGTKDGLKDAFYGPLVAMTDPMYELFCEGELLPEPLGEQIRKGFWKIIPPEQGMVERIVDGHVSLKASGRSGSMEAAYDPARSGRVAVGNFIAVKRFTRGPFKNQTVGFYSGPDTLMSLVEEERGDTVHRTPESSTKAAKTHRDLHWTKDVFKNN